MALFHNEELFGEIKEQISDVREKMKDALICEPFTEDFSRRFCWSSNAIEGNTLSLDETIDFIDFDEVRSGHSYSEYQDTKALYRSICSMLLPFQERCINENLLPVIIESKGDYRQAFRRYDRNGDVSQMVHILAKGELASIERVRQLCERKNI